MPLSELSSPLGTKRAAHLLRRTSFGATRQQIDTFAGLTPQQAVTQLYGQALPEAILPLDPLTSAEWVTGNATSKENELQEFFKSWFLGQMLAADVTPPSQLSFSAREKIVFFLHSHFTAIQSKIGSARALYFQNQLFRMFALDASLPAEFNIRELTKKISVDNAMLRLLDGNQNVKGSPNENYGRELLELYSIGRGLEGSLPAPPEQGDYILYKELDVQQAARVLSGFDFDDSFSTLDPDTMLPRGKVRGSLTNASSHDNGIKQFSNHFNDTIIQPDALLLQGENPTEESALDEIGQLIDMIYASEETAKNICRKLYRFFVYHEITTQVDANVISVMADLFVTGNFKLQPVLENLIRSQHFYEAAAGVDNDNFGGIIKSPLDLLTGTLRFFQFAYPSLESATQEHYDLGASLTRSMGDMGFPFYEPSDVSGYDAYHQYPIYHRSWISVNYLTNRYDFIRQLISGTGTPHVDVVAFVRNTFPNASVAKDLIISLAEYLFPLSDNLTFDTNGDDASGISAERMNYFMIAFLFTPQIDADPEAAWTDRWLNLSDPETTRKQLQFLFNAMLQSPEYQLS